MLDAMGDVVLQHLLLDASQRGAHRRDLRDDVDAVASSSTIFERPRTWPSIRLSRF